MKTSDEIYDEIEFDLVTLGREEILSWKQHPVTKLLMKSLRGDLQYLFEVWSEGDYIKESVDATALTNAKMAGKTQSINSVIDWIETLGASV